MHGSNLKYKKLVNSQWITSSHEWHLPTNHTDEWWIWILWTYPVGGLLSNNCNLRMSHNRKMLLSDEIIMWLSLILYGHDLVTMITWTNVSMYCSLTATNSHDCGLPLLHHKLSVNHTFLKRQARCYYKVTPISYVGVLEDSPMQGGRDA